MVIQGGATQVVGVHFSLKVVAVFCLGNRKSAIYTVLKFHEIAWTVTMCHQRSINKTHFCQFSHSPTPQVLQIAIASSTQLRATNATHSTNKQMQQLSFDRASPRPHIFCLFFFVCICMLTLLSIRTSSSRTESRRIPNLFSRRTRRYVPSSCSPL